MSAAWWPAFLFLAEFAFRFGVILFLLVRGPKAPSIKLAWIVILLALPVVGLVAYGMFGVVRLGVWRTRRHREIVERMRALTGNDGSPRSLAEFPTEYVRTMRLAQVLGGMPARPGNAIELVSESAEFIEALARDVEAARDHCHLLFYIWLADASGTRVGEALIAAARRGVACRLLVDAVGSKRFLESELCARMRAAGVQVVAALPASLLRAAFERIDVRNHRKLAVIDGEIGYTGSQNVADESFALKPRYAPWVDASVRLRGPVVGDLQEIFVEDWFLDAGESLEAYLSARPAEVPGGVPAQVLPTGPDAHAAALQQLAQSAFHLAREELVLTTPYFVPGEAEVTSLATAARRGVRVVLVVPRYNDSMLVAAASRSHYEELLEAGVEIHEYEKGLLHAKTFTVDRTIALVGTANFDRRSFELNFEVSMLIYDERRARLVRALQGRYVQDSRRVRLDDWRRRPVLLRVYEGAAGLFGALL